jgi:WS/DGAT/MGAT family acyltransferase
VERLAPNDAWFLYLENPTVHLHVTGVLVLDTSTAGDDFGFETVRRHFEERLHRIPAMHQRLVEVPLGIDHPIWIEERDVDLDDHVEHHRLTAPGSEAAFAEFVSGFVSEPLDRSRSLWKVAFVEGMEDGRVAVVVKMHHCTVDGVTGVNVLSHLLDLSPEEPDHAPAPERPIEVPPTALEMMADAAINQARSPLRFVRSLARTARSLIGVGGTLAHRWYSGGTDVAHPLNAPRTRFNASVSAKRIVGFEQVPLEDLKTIKRSFDTTVNDVVLAACTHGLRRYLQAQDDLPDRPLVCSVPVSVHQPGYEDSVNQVSDMFVHLPVEMDDPVERLRSIHVGAEAAKEVQQAVGADIIGDIVDLIPPPVFQRAAGAYSQARVADRLPPVHNLIVSNVAGPRDPLYLAGAELVGLMPIGPLMEGTGLNITAVSHVDQVHIALVTCPELVPDAADLAEGIVEGVDVLLDAV